VTEELLQVIVGAVEVELRPRVARDSQRLADVLLGMGRIMRALWAGKAGLLQVTQGRDHLTLTGEAEAGSLL
jgi:hypothetical protein